MTCTYATQTGNEFHTYCSNLEVPGKGIVPTDFCSICPWHTPADGNSISLRHTVVVATEKCWKCPDVKRKNPDTTSETQFIWPYWHAGASGDELRFSIRSVEANFVGKAKITLIGDKPPWYRGHHIPKKRVPSNKPNRSFRDMLSKVWFMATHAEVSETFVWMMDDVYLLRKLNLCDLKDPRAERFRKSKANKWQRIKRNTMQALADRGLPQHDYATHLPHVAEKQKLFEMFNSFDLHTNTMLWEVLYGNSYRDEPIRSRPFLCRIHKPSTQEQIEKRTRGACILNHCESVWNADMRQVLLSKYPEPSSVENDTAPTGFVGRSKTLRMVKRRPKHTHRAVIEAAK